jgi:hypothetical protein
MAVSLIGGAKEKGPGENPAEVVHSLMLLPAAIPVKNAEF